MSVRRAVPLAILWLAVQPAFAAGFAVFEQGAKAFGTAGAFTARADDPSAMFHNVGGLGFMDEREFLVGGSLIFPGDSDFTGSAPFPGPTSRASQNGQRSIVPHAYWVEPVNDQWTFGLSVNAPFGLALEWDDPDNFDGRFIATRSALAAFDVGVHFGVRIQEDLSVGFGLVGRATEIEFHRRSAALNPFSNTVEEIGSEVLETDLEFGFGFTLGLLHLASERVQWGFNYRSKIDVDYSGNAVLTQRPTGDPAFDAVVAGSLPFDIALPIETRVEFPDMAMFGVAVRLSDKVVVEGDLVRTGWSSFDVVDLDFLSEPSLSESLPQLYEDSNTYRFGGSFTVSDRSEWRLGYYFDESPQPRESVGPILPDADRHGFTVGYGRAGEKVQQDYYVLIVAFDDRTTLVNREGFNGTYESTGLLLGATYGW